MDIFLNRLLCGYPYSHKNNLILSKEIVGTRTRTFILNAGRPQDLVTWPRKDRSLRNSGGEEKETDRGNETEETTDRQCRRMDRETILERPRHWHTIAAHGGDWCTSSVSGRRPDNSTASEGAIRQ